MLENLPDIALIRVIYYLTITDCCILKNVSKTLFDRIKSEYCTYYWVQCSIDREKVSSDLLFKSNGNLFFQNDGLVWTTGRNNIRITGKLLNKKFTIFGVIRNYIYVVEEGYTDRFKRYDICKKRFDITSIFSHDIDLIFVKLGMVIYHDRYHIRVYDENLEKKGLYRCRDKIRFKLFEICENTKSFLFVNEKEILCLLDSYGKKKIDNFWDYGGVESMLVKGDKLYLGLKSGNINIYNLDSETYYPKYFTYIDLNINIPIEAINVNDRFIYISYDRKTWIGIIDYENKRLTRFFYVKVNKYLDKKVYIQGVKFYRKGEFLQEICISDLT